MKSGKPRTMTKKAMRHREQRKLREQRKAAKEEPIGQLKASLTLIKEAQRIKTQ